MKGVQKCIKPNLQRTPSSVGGGARAREGEGRRLGSKNQSCPECPDTLLALQFFKDIEIFEFGKKLVSGHKKAN